MRYKEIEDKILLVLENTKFCVFATADKRGVVSASQMCLINNGLTVYFQTDKNFEKIENIKENFNVAINCGPYYFKGIAKIEGHPAHNEIFIEKIKHKHYSTYKNYTNLPGEVLICVQLTECRIWGINEGKCIQNQETITVVDLINKKIKVIKCDKMI